MIQEAVNIAKAAKVAVIVAGLPDAFESEGYDRTHMRMPPCQEALIERVAAHIPVAIAGGWREMPLGNLEFTEGGEHFAGVFKLYRLQAVKHRPTRRFAPGDEICGIVHERSSFS